MENKELKFEYPFRIYSIKTNSFFEEEISEDEARVFDDEKLGFSFTPSFAYDEESKIIKLNFVIAYVYQERQLLKIDTDIVFEFSDFKGVVEDENKINKVILATLLGISFSTIRGIIINRTVGSFINKFYLPIINPTEIINEEF